MLLSPRFSEADLARFYQEEYRKMYCGDANPTRRNVLEQQARAGHLSNLVKSKITTLTSHLDIGCSAGELLLAVRSSYREIPGFRSVGIEPSDAHRTWCAQTGLAVYSSIQDYQSRCSDRFDLVTLSHVLEHLPEPLKFLRELRSTTISERGLLLVEVPNLFGHKSFEIAHCFCFFEKTLSDMLTAAGFKIVFSKLHSIPHGNMAGPLYITVLAAAESTEKGPFKASPVWWRTVQFKRLMWTTRIKLTQFHKITRRFGRFLKRLAKA